MNRLQRVEQNKIKMKGESFIQIKFSNYLQTLFRCFSSKFVLLFSIFGYYILFRFRFFHHTFYLSHPWLVSGKKYARFFLPIITKFCFELLLWLLFVLLAPVNVALLTVHYANIPLVFPFFHFYFINWNYSFC